MKTIIPMVLAAILVGMFAPVLHAQSADYILSTDDCFANASPTRVITLDNGHVLVAGHQLNTQNNNRDGLLVEFNPNIGQVVWSQTYDLGTNDVFSAVLQDDDALVVGGRTNIGLSGSNNWMWFLRIDFSNTPNKGAVLASSTFHDGASNFIRNIDRSTVAGTNGQPSYLITGPANSFRNLSIARVNEDGTIVWNREYSFTGNSDWTYALDEGPGGRIYVGGAYYDGSKHDNLLIQFNQDGSVHRADRIEDPNDHWLVIDALYYDGGSREIKMTGLVHRQTGASSNTQPYFLTVNPNATGNNMIVSGWTYNTPMNTINRGLAFAPILNGGQLAGFDILVMNNIVSLGVSRAQSMRVDQNGVFQQLSTYFANTAGRDVTTDAGGRTILAGSYSTDKIYLALKSAFDDNCCFPATELTTNPYNPTVTSEQGSFTNPNDAQARAVDVAPVAWSVLVACQEQIVALKSKSSFNESFLGEEPISGKGNETPQETPWTTIEAPTDLLHLSPNPAQTVLLVQPTKQGNWTQLQLHDAQGKVWHQQAWTDAQQEIQVADLAPGLYFITLYSETGAVATEKFVKE